MAQPIDFSDAALNDVAAQDLALATSLEKQLWVVATKITQDDAAYQASQGVSLVSKLQYTTSAGFRVSLPTTPAAYLGALWQGIKPFAFDSPIDISAATGDAATLAGLNQAQQFVFLAVKLNQLEVAQKHVSGPGRVGVVIEPQDGFVDISVVLNLSTSSIYKLLETSEIVGDWFVSSFRGNDANDGRSFDLPKATIASIQAVIQPGETLIEEDGSYFRERLILPEGAVVKRSGTGIAKPIHDASDIANNSDFSLASGQANTYQIVWQPGSSTEYGNSGVDQPVVFENDEMLYYRASIAEVDSNPGSFTNLNSNASIAGNITYVHPKSSTNPVTDGKVYQITKRPNCIQAADNCTIDGIELRHAVEENGPFFGLINSTLRNCNLKWGGRHLAYANSGLIEDCTFDHVYESLLRETSNGATLAVFYRPDATGLSGIIRNCRFNGGLPGAIEYELGLGISPAYSHSGSLTSNLHTLIRYEGNTVTNCNLGFNASAERQEIVNNTHSSFEVMPLVAKENVLEGNFFGFDSRSSGVWLKPGTDSYPTIVELRGNKIYIDNQTSKQGIAPSGSNLVGLLMENNSFYQTVGERGSYITAIPSLSSGSLSTVSSYRNIFVNVQESLLYDSSILTNYQGNQNIYNRSLLNSKNILFTADSTTRQFADWQNFSGQDQDSLNNIDPGFSDPENGDFSTTAAEVETLQAGIEYYQA